MIVSDFFLGFHNTILFVYFSFFITVIIGSRIKNNSRSILFGSLLSSVLFFLITNFGVWLTSSMYSKSTYGLIQSYLMGLPFFRNTILSDLIYTFSFFYGFQTFENFINNRINFKKNY